ncbi:hypothetical protein B0T16DRAFT_434251 [Cercophora newfieldiana]|uniref:Uncharacterized protein n=1 Tax=Cercophora newfieldiana TaxID=92897 RepID=A0AA39YSI9_9PEZI|nr:hypothetical protein B0T16DRAFT_434251 [Cercophora newfieldiana]
MGSIPHPTQDLPPPNKEHPRGADTWIYPLDIAHDLDHIPESDIPLSLKQETYTCAWEYTRCVIPVFTNWKRYLAFARIIIIGIVAEFNGALVDVVATSDSDSVLGYDLAELFGTIFGGMPVRVHMDMAREYRAFLLITAEKSSQRRNSKLFRHYVDSLVTSPKAWFRLRDCDALVRFTIAAALACNDFDDVWFSEEELQILAEIGDTLYDAIAFYKHRAEGETNSTFAYVDPDLRVEAFRRCREVLWARYRFVEDNLVIGKAETQGVVKETRRNVKLWNRVDQCSTGTYHSDDARYFDAMAKSDRVMFDGLPELLAGSASRCCDCQYKASKQWGLNIQSLPQRAAKVFPEIKKTQFAMTS